jgi:VWFA-related protein
MTLLAAPIAARSTRQTTAPLPPQDDEEIVRITSELVQTDAVVTDKNDQIVADLKLEDFEVYDNGKRQDLKFIEFVSTDAGRRTEGQRPAAGLPAHLATDAPRDLSAGELRRVFAFVIDDLTIPYEDMTTVRRVLTDFVENQMRPGDLVAIVRTLGGNGLLQQFTSDKQLLRRAIASVNVTTNPYMAFNNPDPARLDGVPIPVAVTESGLPEIETLSTSDGASALTSAANDTTRMIRALMSLTAANFVVDSLKQLPGRKNLVLFSGGLPIFQPDRSGSFLGNVSQLLRELTDNAARAGVAINTMDVQGLKASPAVARFTDTPGRSALGGASPTFGRLPDPTLEGGTPFGQFEGQMGLRALANETGGVSILNTNDFKTGLDKVVNRSSGYYLLAYAPTEKFDNKFHKMQIKVKRDGLKVYTRTGYIAREDREGTAARTKEQVIMAAARSPLARREVDVSANVTLRPVPAANKSEVGIHLLIDARKLRFTQGADGKYQTSFDIAGFIVDELGKTRGGFSETVSTNLSPENYQRVLANGLTYSATTELPQGYFQLRTVVREASTGALGTLTRYLEIPDLSKGRLTMSSLFFHAVNPPGAAGAQAEPLFAIRQLTRRQDLRYVAMIYNPKLSNGKPQLRSQLIISQGGKVLFREPEQAVEPPANNSSPVVKVGQLGLSKVQPGRYILTLVITDTLADKKSQTVSRSLDFTVGD